MRTRFGCAVALVAAGWVAMVGCKATQDARVGAVLALDGDPNAGQGVFKRLCGSSLCHGGDGNAGPAPNFSQVVPPRSDGWIVTVMVNGMGKMPNQSHLTDAQLADVLAYLRASYPKR